MIRKACGMYRVLFGWSSQRSTLSSSSSPSDGIRDTAWLDGVRGVAAFLVMIGHFSMEWLSPFSDAPYGAVVLKTRNPDMVWWQLEGDQLWDIWRLPFLRVFVCSGNAQVAVFFVLSGFVLSWGPLKMVRSGRYEKLTRSLGSSVVRRWFRLYLPGFIVTVIYLFESLYRNYALGWAHVGEELWNFAKGTERWANPFETSRIISLFATHPYSFVMWTLPFEFSGSIFVYVALLALGRVMNYRRRITVMVFISIYAMLSLYWVYWLFGTGLILADYIQQSGGFKQLTESTTRRASRLWLCVFIVGLYLMGYTPSIDWYTTPGYAWLSNVPIPPGYRDNVGEGRFWWGWSGILVVSSACHLSFLRKFFELSPIQYLGKISFMLYLIHFLVHNVVARPLRNYYYENFTLKTFSEPFGGDVYVTSPAENIFIHCVLLALSVPLSMFLAHFLEIFVDRPCTNFGKIIDEKLINGFDVSKPAMYEQEHLLLSTHAPDLEMVQR